MIVQTIRLIAQTIFKIVCTIFWIFLKAEKIIFEIVQMIFPGKFKWHTDAVVVMGMSKKGTYVKNIIYKASSWRKQLVDVPWGEKIKFTLNSVPQFDKYLDICIVAIVLKSFSCWVEHSFSCAHYYPRASCVTFSVDFILWITF